MKFLSPWILVPWTLGLLGWAMSAWVARRAGYDVSLLRGDASLFTASWQILRRPGWPAWKVQFLLWAGLAVLGFGMMGWMLW